MSQSCIKRGLFTLVVSLCAVLSTSCSTMDKLMFWKGAEVPKPTDPTDPALLPENVKSSTVQELELKNAKLWTRVDELEDKVSKQRERLKILERGLMLGILPDELKGDGEQIRSSSGKGKNKGRTSQLNSDASAALVLHEELSRVEAAEIVSKSDSAASEPTKPKPAAVSQKSGEATHEVEGVESASAAATSKLSPKEQEEYQKLLGSAHDHYRAGRYGKAVVEFSEVGKVFGDLVEGGAHRYWIARSWIGLKEYQTARQQLTDFLRDFPASPWAPRAKLELARTEFQLGFKEKSLQRLRELIQAHPYEDAAEMAKMELSNLQKTL